MLKEFSKQLANCPVKVGHEQWLSGDDDPRAIGRSGTVDLKMLKDGEIGIKSTLDIKDSADVIFTRERELSPGYVADYRWQGGISPTGEDFQIVCERINSVNHIAIVPEARGGSECRVMDGGKGMAKIRSGLLWFAKKRMANVNDGSGDTDAFILMLEDVKKNRTIWTPEEFEGHVNSLLGMVQSLPDSEEKEKLKRFILDVPLLRDEDEATVSCCIETLQDFYYSLNRDAISDVMEKSMETNPETKINDQTPPQEPEKKTADEAPTQEPEKKDDEGQTNDETNPDVSKTDNKESEPAPTSDSAPVTTEAPHAATLDDVLSAITALSAMIGQVLDGCHGTRDSAPTDGEEKKTQDAEPEQKEEPKKTEDSMPLYTQSTGTETAGGTSPSLDDVFAKMKGRL